MSFRLTNKGGREVNLMMAEPPRRFRPCALSTFSIAVTHSEGE
jgi:hypothetical protein